MRRLSVIASLIILMATVLMPVQAQGTFTAGVYDFEAVSIGTTGTWTSSTTQGATSIQSTVVSSTATFYAVGNSLMISRLMRITGTSTMQVCVNASCSSVANSNTGQSVIAWHAVIVPLTGGTDTIVITMTAGAANLDYFMVLADPASSFPTAVPTATVLPSSTPAPTATPASTTTPQPTPTPQPSSTPAPTVTPLSYVWALDPQKRYGEAGGQITAVDYTVSAADIHISHLLMALFLSVWGMFLLQVFVLSRFKK